MKSHEVLKKVVGEKVKTVADDLGLSLSSVYKMQDGSRQNCLDRVLCITESTNNTDLIKYLCIQANGYFMQTISSDRCQYHVSIPKIIKKFGELMSSVSESYENDGRIDDKEKHEAQWLWHDLANEIEGFFESLEKEVN